jgi:excinuclease ABC A subunit
VAADDRIRIAGAREHNLKDVSLELPRDALIVITGLSGSGKSSLAFDTIYAEGQRRYVESLSAYARQFLGQMDKPDVDSIEGLSPAISIDQKTTSRNPRSTVGTVTEIYDYLRLLWARVGHPHCYNCGEPIAGQSIEQIVDNVMTLPEGTRFMVLAPVVRGRKGEYKDLLEELRAEGYTRAKIDGEIRLLEEDIELDKKFKHDIAVVVDRLVMKPDSRKRLADSVETAVALAEGIIEVEKVPAAAKAAAGSAEGAGERGEAIAEHAVYRPAERSSFRIARAGDHVFRIEGPAVERLVGKHDLENRDALEFIEERLRTMGIVRALESEGFEPGDEIEIGDVAFALYPGVPQPE